MAMRLSGRGDRAGTRARREQWQPVLARKDAQRSPAIRAGPHGKTARPTVLTPEIVLAGRPNQVPIHAPE